MPVFSVSAASRLGLTELTVIISDKKLKRKTVENNNFFNSKFGEERKKAKE